MRTALNNASTAPMKLLWTALAVLGAVAFGIVALNRGEAVNAAWLVVAAVCIYFIAYRFYGLFVANRALGIDPARATPAYRHNDGLDYVPTNQYVLYGHHFAAIAGAGPLVGPVLAWLLPDERTPDVLLYSTLPTALPLGALAVVGVVTYRRTRSVLMAVGLTGLALLLALIAAIAFLLAVWPTEN